MHVMKKGILYAVLASVLLGTIVAGMLGYMVLNAVLPKVKNK